MHALEPRKLLHLTVVPREREGAACRYAPILNEDLLSWTELVLCLTNEALNTAAALVNRARGPWYSAGLGQ
jgi:hypothetical protein